MSELRIAIVGMGIGRTLAHAFAAHPRARVAALCDLLEERMEQVAGELPERPRFYTDYQKMCLDPEIDAVFVGTPNQWHVPVALEVVRRGKHVLVTKPLADSEQAARELVGAAEAAGVVNMMSLNNRFAIETAHLGRLREEGVFGELYYARARSVRRSGIPDWSPGFIKAGGGAFRDIGVHVLDAAWWMLGMPRPTSILGVSGAKFGPRGLGYWHFAVPPADYYRQFESDDYGAGFIHFHNGAGLQIEAFWASHQPEETQIELFGTEAGARWRPPTLYRTVDGAPEDVVIDLPATPTAWDRLADHFVACVLDGEPCQAPLRHGLIVQRMMEGLLKSAVTGREVRFEEPFP